MIIEAKPKYRPDIDGLRAIAVLSVFFYHLKAKYRPGGFAGVDVFFVISGYVVSGALYGINATSVGQYLSLFYSKRLARLMPALMAVLIATSMLSVLFIPRAWLSMLSEITGSYAFFGLSNWLLEKNTETYFSVRSEFNPFTHTWSLGVEEQFYLIFPLLFYVWNLSQNKKHFLFKIGRNLIPILTVISFLLCLRWSGDRPGSSFYSVFARFWEMGLGALLFQLMRTHEKWNAPRLLHKMMPWLGLISLGISFIFADANRFPLPWALPAVLGTLALIYSNSKENFLRNALSYKYLVWIGVRSYSLYLWHWPVIVLFRWTLGIESEASHILALALSFALAECSYRWIETPFRHFTPERTKLKRRIFAYLVFIGLCWTGKQKLYEKQNSISINDVTRNFRTWYPEVFQPEGAITPCRATYSVQGFPFGEMIQFKPQCTHDQKETVLFVFGDSHAKAYSPMLMKLASETQTTVNLYTGGGCPYLDLRVPFVDRTDPICLGFWKEAQADALKKIQPNDILFLASLRMIRFGDQWEFFKDRNPNEMNYSSQSLDKMIQSQKEALNWLRPFSEKGVRIIFEAPKPNFRSPPFRCSQWFDSGNPICQPGLTIERSVLESLRDPVVTSEIEIAKEVKGVEIWDPFPLLCPKDQCSPYSNNQSNFFDGDHISARGNDLLYPYFVQLIHNSSPKIPEQHSFFSTSKDITFKNWSLSQNAGRIMTDSSARIQFQVKNPLLFPNSLSIYFKRKELKEPSRISLMLNGKVLFNGTMPTTAHVDATFDRGVLGKGPNIFDVASSSNPKDNEIVYLSFK